MLSKKSKVMSINYNFRKKWISASMLIALSVIISSCGTYDNVSYNDGIYGESESVKVDNTPTYQDDSAGYYQRLFEQEGEQFGNNFEVDSVFTDVESYSGGSYDSSNPDATATYGGGSPAWGESPTQISINYIDNGFWGWNAGFGPRWGWNNWAWGWNVGFGPTWGWNNWGWNAGFGPGWGWNNWGWNAWGWNAGFGPGWGWNGAWAYRNGWYGNNFGWGYNRNNFAYVNGSRSLRGYSLNPNTRGRAAYGSRNTTNGRYYSGRSTSNRRSNSISRSSRTSRNSSISRTSRSSTRSTRVGTRSSSSRSSGMRSGSSRTSRSSGMRSSGSSSRSSGMRSGGSSGRSSGGGRSSSSRGRKG
ncbi:vonitellogenin II precursor [Nonlabens tegetincola]|uniref:vonitellogenin II n=2 Tax=Nonlabens tegetincola TaxID=323273 RepID=A0A090Q394_9FLAO|nr:vonitellogenin II precursor [Nonlabens tegetincola]